MTADWWGGLTKSTWLTPRIKPRPSIISPKQFYDISSFLLQQIKTLWCVWLTLHTCTFSISKKKWMYKQWFTATLFCFIRFYHPISLFSPNIFTFTHRPSQERSFPTRLRCFFSSNMIQSVFCTRLRAKQLHNQMWKLRHGHNYSHTENFTSFTFGSEKSPDSKTAPSIASETTNPCREWFRVC